MPAPSRYPKELRKKELLRAAFLDIRTTQSTLDNFTVILTDRRRVVTPFGNAINREMSASWRGRPADAQRYRHRVLEDLKSLTDEVQLIDKSDLTLSGRSATIPVTVQNKLLQGVDRLVLRLESTKPTRLKLNGGAAVAELPVRIEGGHSQSVKFTASANANGPVPMTAQLFTEDGRAYGKPMQFTVKVSEITSAVMLVIAGGVLLLVLAGIRMYTQRKRAAALRPPGARLRRTRRPRPRQPTAPTGSPGAEPRGRIPWSRRATTKRSRVTRRRTPDRKAEARPARVRE